MPKTPESITPDTCKPIIEAATDEEILALFVAAYSLTNHAESSLAAGIGPQSFPSPAMNRVFAELSETVHTIVNRPEQPTL